MQIVILINEDVSVAARVGDPVRLEDVAKVIMQELPERLARVSKKPQQSVAVAAYKYRPDDTKYDIRIIATDVDLSMQKVPAMPYDKVWRAITDVFAANGWLFPSACFRYDTNEHGMANVNGVYKVWPKIPAS